MRYVAALLLMLVGHTALAHHSYAAYDADERYELRGVVKDIHWANPHILVTVSDGAKDMRIEWITVTGAELTQVSKQQFAVGDAIVVIGSRNRDPAVAIMTVIKEIQLPAKAWNWVKPGSDAAKP